MIKILELLLYVILSLSIYSGICVFVSSMDTLESTYESLEITEVSSNEEQ